MAKRPRLPAGHNTLDQILFDQGFGERRVCEGLILNGLVQVNGEVVDDLDAAFLEDRLNLVVDGQPWVTHVKALIMLHKPAGYECSLKPGAWPGVHNLLPVPLRRRGLQPVGRLDQDTTGLLLLTDDGPLLHKLTSPKHHVPKVYEVTCKHPVTPTMCEKLRKGVVLDDDPEPVYADAADPVGEGETLHLRLTLLQGKYHQVKRMVAAVSNRVEGLHRSQIGRLTLPEDLAPGQWRWIEDPAIVLP
ncbi:pseudouridine synthase [Aquabacterium sp.]|jgi:16S rRNA pseudouridine516 synthase|uniref:pseudouridine synthase n=1 Tax=Aquabacterium sp. TaxID=1872578 RepID=UPI00263046FC|nr:pseudouridine synthase [Aquabacterium sp.]MCC6218210.1 16S rRNA pseudouridine(516) synthase [Aquabacterium sp.]MDD2976639.1 pseudouridine synthase [Aquabacterium sp.]